MATHSNHSNTDSSADLPPWRAGMRVRGGRVVHTIARAGWIVFGVFGIAVMVVVAALYTSSPGEDGSDNSPAANFVGGLIVFAPIGAVVFGLLGLGAQAGARAWLRTAPPVVSRAERKERALAEQIDDAGLRASSRWARHYKSCVQSVSGYHDMVLALPDGAAKSWFEGVGQTLDKELTEALRLAKLGDTLEESAGPHAGLSPTASRVDELLQAAAASFAHTAERAAAIALDLRDESDFMRVRAQLDMLAEQAPQLRAAGEA